MKLTRALTGLFVLIPVTVIATFAFLGYGQYKRIEAAKFEASSLRGDIAQVRRLMAALEQQPLIGKHIASLRSEQEQADFLDGLRIHAANANVKIELFVAQAPPVMPVAPAGEPQAETLTSKYQPMLTTVAVVGTYEGTREFAYAIMQSDTLMNMSQVRWEVSNTTGEVRLTCLITRYVTDELPEQDEDTAPTDVSGKVVENRSQPSGDHF